jgi:hypothetical protein
MHSFAIENCPRCQIRDRTAVPLTFKAFEHPETAGSQPGGTFETGSQAPAADAMSSERPVGD